MPLRPPVPQRAVGLLLIAGTVAGFFMVPIPVGLWAALAGPILILVGIPIGAGAVLLFWPRYRRPGRDPRSDAERSTARPPLGRVSR